MTDPTPPHRRSPMEHERDDCPYCAEGALTIAHFQGVAPERERSAARIKALEEHIANMLAAQECACGYDNPTDICLGHATVLKRMEALEEELGVTKTARHADAEYIGILRAERDRLREALNFYVQGCDWQSAPTFCDRPAHMCCKEARAALKEEGE